MLSFVRTSLYSANLINRSIHVTAIAEAARKGTREKARKKKVKVEVQKIGFIPHNLRKRNKLQLSKIEKHIDDSWKAIPTDNCYIGRYYRWTVYTVPEAIECHRETHHPTMYNVPDAPLNVHIELNMQAEKSTKFVEDFNRMAMIPHKFDHGEQRQILVFTKTQDLINEAKSAGATLVGGSELIKEIQNGDLLLADYQYIIAHPNILPELATLRGLMKRKFPNPKNGTLSSNLLESIHKFANGIHYSATKDENQKNFGQITTCIGRIDMDTKHLEENLASLLQDINIVRPKRSGKFITRVLLKSPPSSEQLKIDPFVYVAEEYSGGQQKLNRNNKEEVLHNEEDEDDNEVEEKKEQVITN